MCALKGFLEVKKNSFFKFLYAVGRNGSSAYGLHSFIPKTSFSGFCKRRQIAVDLKIIENFVIKRSRLRPNVQLSLNYYVFLIEPPSGHHLV